MRQPAIVEEMSELKIQTVQDDTTTPARTDVTEAREKIKDNDSKKKSTLPPVGVFEVVSRSFAC